VDTKNCGEIITWTNILEKETEWAFNMSGFVYNGKKIADASKAITG
jgi:hypothetical protein